MLIPNVSWSNESLPVNLRSENGVFFGAKESQEKGIMIFRFRDRSFSHYGETMDLKRFSLLTEERQEKDCTGIDSISQAGDDMAVPTEEQGSSTGNAGEDEDMRDTEAGPSRQKRSVRAARKNATAAPRLMKRTSPVDTTINHDPSDTTISTPPSESNGNLSPSPIQSYPVHQRTGLDKRLSALQNDRCVVVGSVKPQSVRCAGCGQVIILEKGRPYYLTNWKKHRDKKCQFASQVKEGTLEPLKEGEHRAWDGGAIPLPVEVAQSNEEKVQRAKRDTAEWLAARWREKSTEDVVD